MCCRCRAHFALHCTPTHALVPCLRVENRLNRPPAVHRRRSIARISRTQAHTMAATTPRRSIEGGDQESQTPTPIRPTTDYASDQDDEDDVATPADDDASRRPLISPRQTSSASAPHGDDGSNSLQSRAAQVWATLCASLDVYRTEITSRWRESTKRRGKRRSQSSRADNSNNTSASSSSLRALWHQNAAVRATTYTLVGLILVVLLLVAVIVVHLFTSTLSTPSPEAQSRILDEALVVRGPDSLRLLNISDDGIQVRIDARMGLDPDRALDIWLKEKRHESWWTRKDRDVVEWALRKVGGVRVDVGRLTIEEADWSVALEEHVVDLLPHQNKSTRATAALAPPTQPHTPQPLLSFDLEPLFIPFPGLLSPRSLGDNSTRRAHLTMQPLNLTLLFKPASPAPYIVSVVEHFIKRGNATLDIRMASLAVRGLTHGEMKSRATKSRGWSIPGLIKLGQSQVINRVRQAIPEIQPPSDDDEPFLNLTRYDFFESTGGSLGIKAFAQALNPLGELLKGSVKYRVPFGIFLPVAGDDANSTTAAPVSPVPPLAKVLLAAVASEPFELNGQDVIDLVVKGRVVPPTKEANDVSRHSVPTRSQQHVFAAAPTPSSSPQEEALSAFLSRFLRGEPNTVYVRGGSPFSPNDSASLDPSLPGTGSPDLPSWLSSSLSVVDLPISFPGSKVTDLIKNVTLSNLSIKPHPFSDEKLLFSATIRGQMALPGQLKAVDVKINELWPDILVFDGAPPSNGGGGDDDDGGIPDDGGDDDDDDDDDDDERGATTSSEPVPPPPSPLPHGAFGRVRPHAWVPAVTYVNSSTGTKHLESNLTNVPFTILPGRSREFRSFTWKLITAGDRGVQTGIQGASRVHIWNSGLGALEISKLPVEGVFWVGGNGGGDE